MSLSKAASQLIAIDRKKTHDEMENLMAAQERVRNLIRNERRANDASKLGEMICKLAEGSTLIELETKIKLLKTRLDFLNDLERDYCLDLELDQ